MSAREFICEDCGERTFSFEPATDGDVCLICKFIREQPENERASMRERYWACRAATRGRHRVIRWVLGLWHGYQREVDLTILWPECCKLAPDLDHARAAFALHAFHDPAWLSLGEKRITEIIDKLERPL